MVRKDLSEISRLKFYTYLMENYEKLYLNKYTDYISNISYKKLLKKHNIGVCLYHFFIIDFFDVYKEPYLYMYKEFINNLFNTIYKIYLAIKGISSRDVIQDPLKTEDLDIALLKKICEFGYTNRYFVVFHKYSSDLLKFQILKLGNISNVSTKLQQTDKPANYIKGNLNINKNYENLADVLIWYKDDIYMQRNVKISNDIQNKEGRYVPFDFNTYENISRELYKLVKKACNYNEYRETCHICEPRQIKKGRKKKITKTHDGHEMSKYVKKYHLACNRCKTIFKKLAELSNNNNHNSKRVDVMKKSVTRYNKKEPFEPNKERLVRYKRLLKLLNDIAVENNKKDTADYFELKALIDATYR